jgi:hypothetical protein
MPFRTRGSKINRFAVWALCSEPSGLGARYDLPVGLPCVVPSLGGFASNGLGRVEGVRVFTQAGDGTACLTSRQPFFWRSQVRLRNFHPFPRA